MINIIVHTHTIDDNIHTRQSVCGILFDAVSDDGDMVSRSMAFNLGDVDSNLADIISIRLALASLIKECVNHDIILQTTSNYIELLCEVIDGSYIHSPLDNIKEIADMRRLASRFPKLSVIKTNTANNSINTIRTLITKVLDTNNDYDSGTIQGISNNISQTAV